MDEKLIRLFLGGQWEFRTATKYLDRKTGQEKAARPGIFIHVLGITKFPVRVPVFAVRILMDSLKENDVKEAVKFIEEYEKNH